MNDSARRTGCGRPSERRAGGVYCRRAADGAALAEAAGQQPLASLPPPDDIAHQDGVLMAEVTQLNTQLGRYVLRFLDADSGRGPELPPADERALADRVAAVADELRSRAERREQQGDPQPLVGLVGDERRC